MHSADDDEDFSNVDVLVHEELSDDEDGDVEYKTVDAAAFGSDDSDDDEDLAAALRTLRTANAGAATASSRFGTLGIDDADDADTTTPVTKTKPAVIDDFIRNFLIKMGLERTLDAFNTEWYEMQSQGKLKIEDFPAVPDVYLRNQELEAQVSTLNVDLDRLRTIAEKAEGTWDKFRKERDFHRMHHKRVVQEKERLVVDIKRLKKHYSSYEPMLEQLREKYESAMKEKTLMRLDRDRMSAKNEALSGTLASIDASTSSLSPASPAVAGTMPPAATGSKAVSASSPVKQRDRSVAKSGDKPATAPAGKKVVVAKKPAKGRAPVPGDSRLPTADETINPYATLTFDAPMVETYSLMKTFKGHLNPVAGIAFHPKKPIIATVSDDETWKMWSVPNGELIMSGEGHTDWVSGVAFSPVGNGLATASGDCTVKVWDFASASCAQTFVEHTQAVWSVAYHHTGDFIASASMDHTAKLWDVNSGRCRQTFRDHVDSVNQVAFQPYSNVLGTCSGDKTVSLWDVRTGRCIQTFYGHMNACSDIVFNLHGDTIASCDSDGVVKVWDVRMVMERMSLSAGLHPLNGISMDRSGTMLATASDDGTVKVFNLTKSESPLVADLKGHEDSVQCVAFDPFGKFLLSGSSDCTFRIWGGSA